MDDRNAVSAPPDGVEDWKSINWTTTIQAVERLQVRIAKAAREQRWGKVRSLQRILVRSLSAKRLAVRRVTSNRGKSTPGVDGVVWNTSRRKTRAVSSLNRRGYQPMPLRRVYIPKSNGRRRPLGMPTMKDRAMQALHLMALEPVAEISADPNSYGFRRMRSIRDAHVQCFNALSKRTAAQWVFDADIEACFDHISHKWLLDHVPTDKSILRKWLKAGYMEGSALHATEEGTPQGGIISPVLCNLALDGLEGCVRGAAAKRARKASRPKVNVIRYADDFLVTAHCREVLEDHVIPAVAAFLQERGLRLSQEKSRITTISDGFDFLGANIRKYGDKLLMKPTKANVNGLKRDLKEHIRNRQGIPTELLIHQLNRRLRGWANAFRHLVSSRAFQNVDEAIFRQLWRWARRRHSRKGAYWVWRRYFLRAQDRSWTFYARSRAKEGPPKLVLLQRLAKLRIRRHIKVRSAATVYDPAFADHFRQRRKRLQENRGWDRWREREHLRLAMLYLNRVAGSRSPRPW